MNPMQEVFVDLIQPIPLSFITVDPGLGGTGWAYFETAMSAPIHFGTVNDQKGTWPSRSKKIADEIAGIIHGLGDPPVLMEWPGFWGGSVKSFSSMERGDLFKLCYLIGSISQSLMILPRLVAPILWKGQMTKHMTKRRLIMRLGEEFNNISEHCVDAIGMGLALGGLL